MWKSSYFKTPLVSQHVKRSQTLLKAALLSNWINIPRWIESKNVSLRFGMLCLSTYRLSKTSILAIYGRIPRTQLKCNYLRNHKPFLKFHCIFELYIKFLIILKNKTSFKYLRNYWFQKTWLLKCHKGSVSEHPSAVNVLIGSETLLKHPRQYFYPIDSLF